MTNSLFRFALITDAHLTVPESAGPLRAAIEILNAELPDFVVFAGDMMDMGTDEQYALFLDCLRALIVPYYVLPGNHDLGNAGQAARYREAFGPLNSRWEMEGCHCLALDTTNTDPDPNNWHGRVETPALAWLREALAAVPPGAPLLLFTHHGLVGRAEDLSRDVENADAVLGLLRGRRLLAGFCGHAHRLLLNRWEGVPFLATPALSVSRANYGAPAGFLWVDVFPDGVRARFEVAL